MCLLSPCRTILTCNMTGHAHRTFTCGYNPMDSQEIIDYIGLRLVVYCLTISPAMNLLFPNFRTKVQILISGPTYQQVYQSTFELITVSCAGVALTPCLSSEITVQIRIFGPLTASPAKEESQMSPSTGPETVCVIFTSYVAANLRYRVQLPEQVLQRREVGGCVIDTCHESRPPLT